MKIVNKSFVERLRPTSNRSPRTRLNQMLSKINKGSYLFVSKQELSAKGYKSYIGNLINKEIKRDVSIKGYKKGWVITKN